ncbi:MAG TPA: NifU family protein [bacterium]
MTDITENEQVETKTEEEPRIKDLDDFKRRCEEAVEKIRPALNMDGGDCRFLEATSKGDVIIQFMGACQGCSMTTVTLKLGIEQALRDEIPEVREVIAVNP